MPETVQRLYAWLAANPYFSRPNLLRAVALYWGLSITDRTLIGHAGLDAIVDHELRAAGVAANGLLVLSDHSKGIEVLRLDGLSPQRVAITLERARGGG